MKKICNATIDEERSFYASKNIEFENINIEGPTDGESAFKECNNIVISNSNFHLRYPMWHDTKLKVNNSTLYDTCRAPIWYSKNIEFTGVKIEGVKAFRECDNINAKECDFNSEEIFWNCKKITISDTNIKSVYAFFGSSDIVLKNVSFSGKYSFQYTKNIEIIDSVLDTKDAFWHCNNVVVRNSIVKGEYLGWYSNNLTLINCKITGTQPLCYAKNLVLIDCTMEDCDLALEYSEVSGNIQKKVKSIKNPLSGELRVDEVEKFIVDENDRSKGRFKLFIMNKR